MADEQPKKTLSEAQRLAFLKGREKRMANIEKKKLEEQEKLTLEAKVFSPPPKPKLKRQTKTRPETPMPEPQSPKPVSDPTPVAKVVTPEKKRSHSLSDEHIDDMVSKIMSKIDHSLNGGLVDKLIASLQPVKNEVEPPPQKKTRKPRAKKESKKKEDSVPSNPPPTNNFTWM